MSHENHLSIVLISFPLEWNSMKIQNVPISGSDIMTLKFISIFPYKLFLNMNTFRKLKIKNFLIDRKIIPKSLTVLFLETFRFSKPISFRKTIANINVDKGIIIRVLIAFFM